MTIEAQSKFGLARTRLARQWPQALGAIAAVLGGWIVVLVGLTFISPAGKAMAIIGSPSRAIAIIAAADGFVLNSNGVVTIARSDDADFVARLYAAGALLVLDAEQAGGCSGARRGLLSL